MCELDTCVQQFSEWVVDIDATANKVDIDKEEAEWNKPTIYRVTNILRSQNPKAYTPQFLSFGPFHHGAEHLKPQDVHKRRALAHFLRRSRKQAQDFISSLHGILKELQDSYQGLDEKWKENPYEFLKMMLLDGCFMLEVLRLKEHSENYAPNDPFFSLGMFPLHIPYIKRDMLLLENQLPLLVLKVLLEVEGTSGTSDEYINRLVLRFCNEYYFRHRLSRLADHPLELYRLNLLQGNCQLKTVDEITCGIEEIPNAVELYVSGVHFKISKTMSLQDITFNPKTGVLRLPIIPVHDGTEYLFLNMIAYEQTHVGVCNEVRSFVSFMSALMDTKEDAKLLQNRGIISSLGSNKDVAQLFNGLAKEAAMHPNDTLNSIRFHLIRYYEKNMNTWQGNLWRLYNLYPGLFTLVSTMLSPVILCTVVQTLYTILTFYLRK